MTTVPPPGDVGFVGAELIGEPAAGSALLPHHSVEWSVHRTQLYAHNCALSSKCATDTHVRVPRTPSDAPPDPYGLAAARTAAGMTTEALVSATYDHPLGKVSKSMYTQLVAGTREASDVTLITFGDCLGLKAGTWPQYDLARVRAALNPRLAGSELAQKNYARVAKLIEHVDYGFDLTETGVAELVEAEADRTDATRRARSGSAPKTSRRKGREA